MFGQFQPPAGLSHDGRRGVQLLQAAAGLLQLLPPAGRDGGLLPLPVQQGELLLRLRQPLPVRTVLFLHPAEELPFLRRRCGGVVFPYEPERLLQRRGGLRHNAAAVVRDMPADIRQFPGQLPGLIAQFGLEFPGSSNSASAGWRVKPSPRFLGRLYSGRRITV